MLVGERLLSGAHRLPIVLSLLSFAKYYFERVSNLFYFYSYLIFGFFRHNQISGFPDAAHPIIGIIVTALIIINVRNSLCIASLVICEPIELLTIQLVDRSRYLYCTRTMYYVIGGSVCVAGARSAAPEERQLVPAVLQLVPLGDRHRCACARASRLNYFIKCIIRVIVHYSGC